MLVNPLKLTRRQILKSSAAVAGAAASASGLVAAMAPTASASTGAAPQPAPEGRYRIDLHAHFLPPEYRNSLLAHGYFTIGGYPTPEWSPDAALDFMDRWGIEAQVLSLSDPGVSYLHGTEAVDMANYVNRYAADLIRDSGDRFGAFAVLPLPDVLASIRELEYALDTLKLDGVAVLSAYDGIYLGDPRFEPLMFELNRRNAYVFIHPAAIPPTAKPHLPLPDFLAEFTFDTTRAAAMLMTTGVMDRYPNIRFELAHAGGTVPFLSHRLGLINETVIGENWPDSLPRASLLNSDELIRRFYYDTALSAAAAPMRSILEVSSLDHIVFGSDWPFSALTLAGSGDPAPGLSKVFSAEERRRIERDNPLAQVPGLAGRIAK